MSDDARHSTERSRGRRAAGLGLIAIGALLLIAAPAGAAVRLFHTPGGNIGCALADGRGEAGGLARCDVAHHSWKAPPKPASCPLDWGNGLFVGPRHKARFVCAGDTTLNQGKVLKAGRSIKVGRYRCTSLPGAVRCVNTRNGHGFKVSRTEAKRF